MVNEFGSGTEGNGEVNGRRNHPQSERTLSARSVASLGECSLVNELS